LLINDKPVLASSPSLEERSQTRNPVVR